ncbi:MAG: hypothetical protein CVT48_00375 [Thermoplasmata archaeon HGW-Thermoplasmata-1]|nr:MAG: hypothetical protein CVT48_00375 [Thermoplasmata archaeon HGW-Thermoplasmata-1]
MVYRAIWDAFTKSKILEHVYADVSEMSKKTQKMFGDAFDCVLDNKPVMQELIYDDTRLNKYEISVRVKIMNYLALNRAPDINAALMLLETVVHYERIGDYCKNIAQISCLYPADVKDGEYKDKVKEMMGAVGGMFPLVHDALKHEDVKKAEKAAGMHNKTIKKMHAELIALLNKQEGLTPNQAIVYAALGMNLRRISAHLYNTASGVINPFPEMGFERGKYTDKSDEL